MEIEEIIPFLNKQAVRNIFTQGRMENFQKLCKISDNGNMKSRTKSVCHTVFQLSRFTLIWTHLVLPLYFFIFFFFYIIFYLLFIVFNWISFRENPKKKQKEKGSTPAAFLVVYFERYCDYMWFSYTIVFHRPKTSKQFHRLASAHLNTMVNARADWIKVEMYIYVFCFFFKRNVRDGR